MGKIMTLLIVGINHRLKQSKILLETEEKAKEIANLQGGICGLKKLLDYLLELFSSICAITYIDEEEKEIIIEKISTAQINELYKELTELIETSEWKELLKRTQDNREKLKEMLFSQADCARDLYLAQAQQDGLTYFNYLLGRVQDEYSRREEELTFDDGAENEVEE